MNPVPAVRLRDGAIAPERLIDAGEPTNFLGRPNDSSLTKKQLSVKNYGLSGPSNRLLPSALKSFEYLIAAACEMKDWPLATDSCLEAQEF